jgi:hydroxyacylglutathione hydrolase
MTNIIPISAFKDNYIWTLHNRQYAVVVDPGDAAPVLDWLYTHQIKLVAILCTHHHHDHVGGICKLVEVYNVPVYGPQQEEIPCITNPVGKSDSIKIVELGIQFEVMEIPGHTRGHIAFFINNDGENPGTLFCGDTLFGCGCGRLFEGTASQLLHSLKYLAQLPGRTRVYCAHEYTEANILFALACEPGNPQLEQRREKVRALRLAGLPTLPSTIALELTTNPFLRCAEPEIIHTLSQRCLNCDSELDVFTALREWKNHF